MGWFIAATVVIVACSGLAVWWLATTRLARAEATAVYDIEQAVDYVAEKIPSEVDDRLHRDSLRWLLMAHLEFLRRSGMATFGGVDEVAMTAATGGQTIVAHEDDAVDYVYSRLLASTMEGPTLVDVVVVVDLGNQYLGSIGALGHSVRIGSLDLPEI